ncbi:7370_t:CDS:2 [Cetraspora pellucida]|uniref:7370_t:CDS:1 n=1 Tax=Cetraspora pellucida TaxID=1433469 RepID=A0A9N9DAR4_9GLOM|nr:7370_t:CDS:2 [Cetraspora pellucida]
MVESSQMTITQAFNKQTKYPFSILQSLLFKRIIEELDERANILSKDYLNESLINAEDKILRNLHEYAFDDTEICYTSFTTDIWMSNNSNPYIGLTIHWINNDFQMKEMISSISCLSYPHTADHLLNKIVEILDYLQLRDKTVCSTVDNWSNIKLCVEKLEYKYNILKVFGFGHTLQLAINDALKECSSITNLIKKCKDVILHFSGSLKQKQFLLTAQIEMEDWDRFLCIVCDVSTRWNSTFYLLKRLTILKPALYKYKLLLAKAEYEKQMIISEARTEYDHLNSNKKLDNILEIEDQMSGDEMDSEEDIFSNLTSISSQEQSNQNIITDNEFDSYLLLPKVSNQTDVFQWYV